jgi:hypothetical protein
MKQLSILAFSPNDLLLNKARKKFVCKHLLFSDRAANGEGDWDLQLPF